MRHLDEVALNEYLDAVLALERRIEIEAHLAECPECAARLDELRRLFAALEATPDAPLQPDLSPAVMAALRPESRVAAPTLRLVFAAQALIALVLLGLAWPSVVRTPEWAFVSELGEQAAGRMSLAWAAAASELVALPTSAQRIVDQVFEMTAAAQQVPVPALPSLGVGLCLAAASALWLLGNGLLLRRQFSSLLRSQS